MAAVTLLLAAGGLGRAQQPEARKVATEGLADPNEAVWSAAIAAGTNKVMAVYALTGSSARVGYAIATVFEHIPPGMDGPSQKPWRWVEEGLVPLGEATNPHDPTVAYDSVTHNFVLAGQATVAGRYAAPFVAIYDAALESFGDGWKRIYLDGDPNQPAPMCDRPWIVAGEVIPPTNGHEHQELYICYTGWVGLVCLRSTDGGYTWNGGEVAVSGQTVYGTWPQPAVEGDGPLYIASREHDPNEPERIRFLRGTDVNDPRDPDYPMTWDRLYRPDDPNDPDDFLEVSFYKGLLNDYLPMSGTWCHANLFPMLAVDPGVDPNNPDVLYLVYHDTVEEPNIPPPPWDIDVDVFLHKLTEQEDGTWLAGGRVRVNDPDPNDPPPASPTDQFHPAVTVTPGPTPEETRVHVIFYDDRRFDEQIDVRDPNDPNDPFFHPKFDVYYAYSDDAGESFEQADELLFLNDPEDPNDPPAVDYTVLDPNDPDFILRDYIGIARQVQGSGYRIWTSYMGTYEDDPTEHKSVIWSTQIPWPSP